jgi:hypothetical protein
MMQRASVGGGGETPTNEFSSVGESRVAALLFIAYEIPRALAHDSAADEVKEASEEAGEGGEGGEGGVDPATLFEKAGSEALERSAADTLCAMVSVVASHGGDVLSLSDASLLVSFTSLGGPGDSTGRAAACGLQLLSEFNLAHDQTGEAGAEGAGSAGEPGSEGAAAAAVAVAAAATVTTNATPPPPTTTTTGGSVRLTLRGVLALGELDNVILTGAATVSAVESRAAVALGGGGRFKRLVASVRRPAGPRWSYGAIGDVIARLGVLIKRNPSVKDTSGLLLLDESVAWLASEADAAANGGNLLTDGTMRRLARLEDSPDPMALTGAGGAGKDIYARARARVCVCVGVCARHINTCTHGTRPHLHCLC